MLQCRLYVSADNADGCLYSALRNSNYSIGFKIEQHNTNMCWGNWVTTLNCNVACDWNQ